MIPSGLFTVSNYSCYIGSAHDGVATVILADTFKSYHAAETAMLAVKDKLCAASARIEKEGYAQYEVYSVVIYGAPIGRLKEVINNG